MTASINTEKQTSKSEEYRHISQLQQQYSSAYEPTSGRMRNDIFPIGPFFQLAIRFLPHYVNSTERKKVADDHPIPILNVNIDTAKPARAVASSDAFEIPQHFVEQIDKAYWLKGLLALQEIATERLRRDITLNMEKEMPYLKSIFGKFGDRLSYVYDMNPEMVYIKSILTEVFGDDCITFERELARAMLTGDHSDVNESLTGVLDGNNLDDFAWKLMEIAQRLKNEDKDNGRDSEKPVTKEDSQEFGSFDFNNGVIETQILREIYELELAQKVFTQILNIKPGNLHNLAFRSALIASGIVFPESLQLYIQVVLHEIGHYMSMTKKGVGFFTFKS